MTNWIEWKGGECPVSATAVVAVKFRCGRESLEPYETAHDWEWGHYDGSYDIAAYRVTEDAAAPAPYPKLAAAEAMAEALRSALGCDLAPDVNERARAALAAWESLK